MTQSETKSGTFPILKCLSWNITSINDTEGKKTDNDHFIKILKQNDIICLQETKGDVVLPGYTSYTNLRKNVKKPSGGVVTLVSKQLKQAVSKVNCVSNRSSDIIIVKLKHNFINSTEDIYIINVYIRPHNSKLRFTKMKGVRNIQNPQ